MSAVTQTAASPIEKLKGLNLPMPSNMAIGTAAVFGIPGYLMRRSSGKGVIRSVVEEAAMNIPFAFGVLPGIALTMAIPMAPMIGQALATLHHRQQMNKRSVRTPFSHRFEWTDAAASSTRNLHASLSGGGGFVGSEAAAMHSRYGRR